MRHLCLPLVLVIISGVPTQTVEEVRDVVGNQGDDVLLPCNCVDGDKERGFKWQTENPASLIFKVEPPEETYGENYTTRVETFANENSNNCSILLKYITEDDNKTYTCRFIRNGVCKFHTVNLKVVPATTSTVPPDTIREGSSARLLKDSRRYFTIIPVVALLLIMGCIVGVIGIIYLNQRRCWGAPVCWGVPNKKEKLLSSEDV